MIKIGNYQLDLMGIINAITMLAAALAPFIVFLKIVDYSPRFVPGTYQEWTYFVVACAASAFVAARK